MYLGLPCGQDRRRHACAVNALSRGEGERAAKELAARTSEVTDDLHGVERLEPQEAADAAAAFRCLEVRVQRLKGLQVWVVKATAVVAHAEAEDGFLRRSAASAWPLKHQCLLRGALDLDHDLAGATR